MMEDLIKRAEEKGLSVEDLIILALSREDPQEGVRLRLRLAEEFMRECDEFLSKGDAVQASEKAYKVAEEIVKALAEKFNTQEYQQFVKEGRWYTYLLSKASSALSSRLGNWIVDGWSSAYLLHAWGFHEAKLTVNDVLPFINRVRDMLKEAKKVL